MQIKERSHSGLLRELGKPVYRKVSRVQIPPSPQRKNVSAKRITFNAAGTLKFLLKISYVPPYMFYYIYILQSQKNNSLYIGYTSALKKRFKEHNNGESLSTKPFIPYKLIFYEAFLNRIDAKNRELYLKSGYGRKTIKSMLRKNFENI